MVSHGSEQLPLSAELGLPEVVFTLACEDQAVSVERSLPEHMDVLAGAIRYGLQMVVLPTDCDCALLGHDGGCEISHRCSPSVGVVDADVAAHGLEHDLLRNAVLDAKRFGHEGQVRGRYVLELVVHFVDDALGIASD